MRGQHGGEGVLGVDDQGRHTGQLRRTSQLSGSRRPIQKSEIRSFQLQQRGTDLRVSTETGGACRRRLQRVEQAGERPGLGCFGGQVGWRTRVAPTSIRIRPPASISVVRMRIEESSGRPGVRGDQCDDAAVIASPSRCLAGARTIAPGALTQPTSLAAMKRGHVLTEISPRPSRFGPLSGTRCAQGASSPSGPGRVSDRPWTDPRAIIFVPRRPPSLFARPHRVRRGESRTGCRRHCSGTDVAALVEFMTAVPSRNRAGARLSRQSATSSRHG